MKVCAIKFNQNLLYMGKKKFGAFQINHQPDAPTFQFIILTFIYSSTCFGRFPTHHQELDDCSGSLWFYLRIVVTVVLCSRSRRLHLFGDLFELYDDARTYKP